jgi:hypothetical protein
MTNKIAEELRAQAAELRKTSEEVRDDKIVKCAQIVLAAKGLAALKDMLETGVSNDN